jgi:hypothetical protein
VRYHAAILRTAHAHPTGGYIIRRAFLLFLNNNSDLANLPEFLGFAKLRLPRASSKQQQASCLQWAWAGSLPPRTRMGHMPAYQHQRWLAAETLPGLIIFFYLLFWLKQRGKMVPNFSEFRRLTANASLL